MGLPGKPEGIDGGEVERYFLEGRIKEIADYCETDVVNTYPVWQPAAQPSASCSAGAIVTPSE